jgi:hypothetical protein
MREFRHGTGPIASAGSASESAKSARIIRAVPMLPSAAARRYPDTVSTNAPCQRHAEPSPRPQAPTDGSAQRTCASSADGSRHRHPEASCRCPAPSLAGNRPVWASAPPTYPPCECRLPAGLTEHSGRASGVRREGLDHWSSEPRAAPAVRDGAVPGRMPPHRAPDGPFLTSLGLLGPCARATTEQPRGQNGHEKNDLGW